MKSFSKNKIIKVILLLFTSILCKANFSFAQDATDIIKKADEKLRGKSSYAELTIQIVRPTWKREMKMKSWSKGDDYALILVTAPAKEKGTVSLKRDKEVWNWLPSIERTIKLPRSMMMQSWMGTDFTNDDLVKQSSIVTDYIHELAGDSVIENRNCYKVIMKPKPEATVVWGKVIVFVDKKEYLEMRVEYYDEDGALVNIMTGSELKILGGKLLPSRMEMIPVDKPGNKTVLIYNNLKFDIAVDDDFFSVRNMSKIK